MNFHTDEWIMDRVREHYDEACQYYPEERIIGIFYNGSANYGLDCENSDVDTKCLIVPTIEEISKLKEPVSHTHIRANNEHIDFKDIREYIKTFKKQNLNFLEILFTPYYILSENEKYKEIWDKLVYWREGITHFNKIRAIKSMVGVMFNKYHMAFTSTTAPTCPFGYDAKSFMHIMRVYEYIEKYIAGLPYEQCLKSSQAEYLKLLKNGHLSLEAAKKMADEALEIIKIMSDKYTSSVIKEENYTNLINNILDEAAYNFILEAFSKNYFIFDKNE